VQELIEARRAGTKLKDVAERYGISESTVKRIMRALSELPGWTEDQYAALGGCDTGKEPRPEGGVSDPDH